MLKKVIESNICKYLKISPRKKRKEKKQQLNSSSFASLLCSLSPFTYLFILSLSHSLVCFSLFKQSNLFKFAGKFLVKFGISRQAPAVTVKCDGKWLFLLQGG